MSVDTITRADHLRGHHRLRESLLATLARCHQAEKEYCSQLGRNKTAHHLSYLFTCESINGHCPKEDCVLYDVLP